MRILSSVIPIYTKLAILSSTRKDCLKYIGTSSRQDYAEMPGSPIEKRPRDCFGVSADHTAVKGAAVKDHRRVGNSNPAQAERACEEQKNTGPGVPQAREHSMPGYEYLAAFFNATMEFLQRSSG